MRVHQSPRTTGVRPTTRPRPIRRGDVLDLRNEDYLFGEGDMQFRILAVYEIRKLHGDLWVFLGGLELRADGNSRRPRDVLVRSQTLWARLRRPE
jgi:hypothetical protein